MMVLQSECDGLCGWLGARHTLHAYGSMYTWIPHCFLFCFSFLFVNNVSYLDRRDDEAVLLNLPEAVYPVHRAKATFTLLGKGEEFR